MGKKGKVSEEVSCEEFNENGGRRTVIVVFLHRVSDAHEYSSRKLYFTWNESPRQKGGLAIKAPDQSNSALKLISSRFLQLLCNKPNYFSSKANPSIELLMAQNLSLPFDAKRLSSSFAWGGKKLNFQLNWLRIGKKSLDWLMKRSWFFFRHIDLAGSHVRVPWGRTKTCWSWWREERKEEAGAT